MSHDGTTAIHVSPDVPSEDDMNKAKDFFSRGLNAILELAQITKDVATLRDELATLTDEVRYVRERNVDLDRMLNDARHQRDEADAKVAALTQDNAWQRVQLTDYDHEAEVQANTIRDLQGQLALARTERDDYGMKHLHAVEELRAAYEVIDNFKSMAGRILGTTPSNTVLVSELTPLTPLSEPSPVPAIQPEPAPLQQPSVDWNKPYRYNEAAQYWENYTPEPEGEVIALPDTFPWPTAKEA